MPLLILVFVLVDLLSIGFVFLDYYLWREWYEYRNTAADDYADRCLYGAIALLAFILLGKFLMRMILSTQRKGEDEPKMFVANRKEILKRADGTQINIEHYGKEERQAIIFVHGWNANSKEWYYQRKHFEKNFHLIMMDLPGLGKSTRPANKNFSLQKMSSDLNAVIEHTGAKNPILWGHSIGGMIILTLLAKNNNANRPQVKGVILEHTTYTNPVRTIMFSKLMTAIQKPVLVPICWLLIFLSPIVWAFRWLSYLNGNSHIMTRLLTFTGTQTPKQLEFITLLSTLAPPAVTARGVLGMFHYDVSKSLANITTPALVIAANKDRLTKPVASEVISQAMPNAQIRTVAPGGHQGLIERYREVNEAAENFIQSLTKQTERKEKVQ